MNVRSTCWLFGIAALGGLLAARPATAQVNVPPSPYPLVAQETGTAAAAASPASEVPAPTDAEPDPVPYKPTKADEVFSGNGCAPIPCGEGCCTSEGCPLFGKCPLISDGCCLGEPEVLIGNIGGGINIGGWIQAGYHSDSTQMFNDFQNEIRLHQSWLYAEKVADGSCGTTDWGFRVDLMYGIDAGDTQAFGNPAGNWDWNNGWDRGRYGWAMPQAYLELAEDDLSIIVGHFYTLLGYETVTAPDNFFYSHAMTMYNSEAFTHTGFLATYTVNDDVEAYAGWTLGWDTGFDQLHDGSNFLGGVSTTLTEDVSLTYITTIGQMGSDIHPDAIAGRSTGRGEGYSHSIVMDTALTDNLNYVVQTDLVSFRIAGPISNAEVGLNQYLIYTVNDCLSFGTRVEWWKSNAGFRGAPLGTSVSHNSVTLGANYRPTANVTLRPEWRQDWTPGIGYTRDIWAMDAILTF